MYIIKNALQNLMRNRGRNTMMAAIVFVVIVSSVAALMIYNTSDGVINDYKSRFGSEVHLTPNFERLMETSGNMTGMKRPTIPPEQLIAFADSEYLLSARLTATGRGSSSDLKAIDEERGGGGGPMLSGGGPAGGSAGGTANIPEMRQYYFRLLANQYSDFENGNRALTEGSRYPEKPGECLISQELLENSHLSIGDTVTVKSDITNPGGGPGQETYQDIEFVLTIVGTYIDLTDEYGNSMRENAFSNRRNEIFMFFGDLAGEVREGYMGIELDATYFLKSPELLEAFSAELRAKGLDEVFDVTTDEASYRFIVNPVEAMKGISFTFVIMVLLFGAIIIALLSSLAIRERKYEIGVLRAMGMKKIKVALGLWTETVVITAVCLVFGLVIGGFAAQPITNILLDQQLAASEQAQSNTLMPSGPGGPGGPITVISSSGGGPTTGGLIGQFMGQASAEAIANIDVSLDQKTILEIIVIALLLSTVSGLVAALRITKYEPMKILMERN